MYLRETQDLYCYFSIKKQSSIRFYRYLKLQYPSFSDYFLPEYIGASIYLYYTPAYLYIYIYQSIAQNSRVQVDQPSANHSLSFSCLEWEVPRELLLHRPELIPPPVLGFKQFEENKYTSIKRRRMIVKCNEEYMEKKWLLTDRKAY